MTVRTFALVYRYGEGGCVREEFKKRSTWSLCGCGLQNRCSRRHGWTDAGADFLHGSSALQKPSSGVRQLSLPGFLPLTLLIGSSNGSTATSTGLTSTRGIESQRRRSTWPAGRQSWTYIVQSDTQVLCNVKYVQCSR